MGKITAIILSLFCSLSAIGQADFTILAIEARVASASCPADGSPSEEQDATSNSSIIGDSGGRIFAGQKDWTPGANHTICKLRFHVVATGDITSKTYRAYVYTVTGNDLNAVVGSSDAITGNNAWSGEVVFTLTSTAAVSSGTPYSLVLKKESGINDDMNYLSFVWGTSPSPDISGGLGIWDSAGVNLTDGPTWGADIGIYWQ